MAGYNVNRKKAPRRQVVDVVRTGSWGRVVYEHKLDCGHVESRKRKAASSTLSCAGCVLAEQKDAELSLQPRRVADDETILDLLGSRLAVSEKDAAQMKAALIAKLNVPQEAVDMVLDDDEGTLQLSYAVILLSADEVMRMLSDE